jgi:hypothetical protein
MQLKTSEAKDGINWLIRAGVVAIIFSAVLYYTDEHIMGGAIARDKQHAEMMKELRVAQSALPARVTDERQTLPLTLEQEEAAGKASH